MSVISPILALPAPLATGISPQLAQTLAFGVTGAYVGGLYVAQHFFGTKTAAPNEPAYPPPGHRNHPATMRLRMKAVISTTRLCMAGVFWTVKRTGNLEFKGALKATIRLLGLSTAAIRNPLAYLLAPLLFIGPLYSSFLDGTLPGQHNAEPLEFGLTEQRNYVIGPLTEELSFRSCIIAVSLLGHLSPKWIVFGTPLWFGLAHVHHAVEVFRQLGSTRRAAISATASAVFQLGYTSLFGWYASYLYLRTGSVVPSMAAHIFCNYMGLPDIAGAIERNPKRKLSIAIAYLAGIAGFVYGLKRL